MSINNVVGILSSTVSSTSTFAYLTKLLPDDVLLIIASFAGSSFTKLALTSKSICESINIMSDYLMASSPRNIILPLGVTALTSTILCLNFIYYKKWGLYSTTIDKELLFREAIRTGSISTMKHLISLGIDVDGIKSSTETGADNKTVKTDFFPIQDAVYSNDPEKVRLLLDYANISPNVIVSWKFRRDWYDDLLSYTSDTMVPPVQTNIKIPQMILEEHIKQRNFSLFFERDWRSDIRVFKWFCTALSNVPRGLQTGYTSRCDNLSCKKRCSNIRICNGLMLCEKCANSKRGPGKEAINESNYIQKLWIEPYSENYYDYYGNIDQNRIDAYNTGFYDDYDYEADYEVDYDEKYGRYDRFERD
jgi:hypothetical protein